MPVLFVCSDILKLGYKCLQNTFSFFCCLLMTPYPGLGSEDPSGINFSMGNNSHITVEPDR